MAYCITIMVREFTERKQTASYDLVLLQRLAAADAIIYAGREVEKCLLRLKYSHDHLRQCIANLRSEDFHVSGRYAIEGTKPVRYTFWMDVYRYQCTYYPRDDSNDDPRDDDLYIKLSLSGDCVTVTVQSFHEWGRVS